MPSEVHLLKEGNVKLVERSFNKEGLINNSKLEPRNSILKSIEYQGSSFKLRLSTYI